MVLRYDGGAKVVLKGKKIVTNHPSNENRFFLFIDIIGFGVDIVI